MHSLVWHIWHSGDRECAWEILRSRSPAVQAPATRQESFQQPGDSLDRTVALDENHREIERDTERKGIDYHKSYPFTMLLIINLINTVVLCLNNAGTI